MNKPKHVAIAWSGLPPYAAFCIEAFIQRGGGAQLQILSTRSRIAHRNVESRLSRPIHWIENTAAEISWEALDAEIPDVFLLTGWAIKPFNKLAEQVRLAGGQVVLMSDNNWIGTPRQIVGTLWFSLFRRQHYDQVFVPGLSGQYFAERLGFDSKQIHQGLYGGDPAVFFKGVPLEQRPKRMLFVGQLIGRKGIPELLDALKELRESLHGWTIAFMGDGPLKAALADEESVEVLDFGTPGEVAAEMRRSRFFILPSREEHWGVVVHEAALSGCGLILSRSVGAAPDFLSMESAFIHAPNNSRSIVNTLKKALEMEGEALNAFGDLCHKNAMNYGPGSFADAVERMI